MCVYTKFSSHHFYIILWFRVFGMDLSDPTNKTIRNVISAINFVRKGTNCWYLRRHYFTLGKRFCVYLSALWAVKIVLGWRICAIPVVKRSKYASIPEYTLYLYPFYRISKMCRQLRDGICTDFTPDSLSHFGLIPTLQPIVTLNRLQLICRNRHVSSK